MIHTLPMLLLGIFIKTTLLLLLAWAACRLMRQASAATRHLVWSVALVGVLLLPLLSMALPSWNVRWKIASRPSPMAPIAVLPKESAALSDAVPAQGAEPAASAPEPATVAAVPTLTPPEAVSSPRNIHSPRKNYSYSTLLLGTASGLVIWSVGFFLVLSQFLVGLRRIGQIRRQAAPLDGAALALAEEVRLRLGTRPVEFLRAIEDCTVTVPVTWGLFCPVVVLPVQSSAWSEDCLRAALLHELAHVSRRDWPTQVASRLTCALYWWHPLVWWAARQAREESERACDDLVLGMGMKAADYAQRLVEVVRSMPEGAPSRTVAIAMAQPSEVEGRVKAVLAKGQNRSRLSWRALAVTLASGSMLVLPLSAVRPVARAAAELGRTSPEQISSTNTLTHAVIADPITAQATLPNGVTLKLLGVKDSQAGSNRWWRPDGSALTVSLPVSDLPFSNLPTDSKGRVFAVNATYKTAAQPQSVWTAAPKYLGRYYARVEGSHSRYYAEPNFTNGFDPEEKTTDVHGPQYQKAMKGTQATRLLVEALSSQASQKKSTLIYGVAAGPWTQSVTCKKTTGKVSIQSPSGQVTFTLVPNPHHLPAAQAAHANALLMVSDHFRAPSPAETVNTLWADLRSGMNYDRTVLALDASGRVVTEVRYGVSSQPSRPSRPGDFRTILSGDFKTTLLDSIPVDLLKSVASFRLLARPYQFVEFRNVQLQQRAIEGEITASAFEEAWQAKEQKSLSNMRRINLSIVQYSQDHDGRLPSIKSITLLRMELGPYLKFQDKVVDQTTGQPFGPQAGDTFLSPLSGRHYHFVSAFSNTLMTKIRLPASTILFSDVPMATPRGSKKGRWVLEAFADGNVRGRAIQ